MGKNIYNLKYDIDRDMWNWRGATEDMYHGNKFMGATSWKNARFIEDDVGREIALKIGNLDKKAAENILRPYLENILKNPNSRLNKFMQIAEKEFTEKFEPACEILEKITQHPMISNEFTFFITTFPRMPYFLDTFEIFIFDSTEEFWGMPIDGFLHEALHYQFTYYWGKREDIMKLNDEQFDYIKEALTVVLDEELQPILTTPDRGYDNQQAYRALLKKHWKKYHDFGALINFALSTLNLKERSDAETNR